MGFSPNLRPLFPSRMRSSLRYVSTRGQAPKLGFEAALLTGLARDGGLYVPETWPNLSASRLAKFAGRPYADVGTAFPRR